ncbi:hypothetical protein ACTFIZ_000249 [Dictyostelium cf. discoideum]
MNNCECGALLSKNSDMEKHRQTYKHYKLMFIIEKSKLKSLDSSDDEYTYMENNTSNSEKSDTDRENDSNNDCESDSNNDWESDSNNSEESESDISGESDSDFGEINSDYDG